jgi:hypothetical protein
MSFFDVIALQPLYSNMQVTMFKFYSSWIKDNEFEGSSLYISSNKCSSIAPEHLSLLFSEQRDQYVLWCIADTSLKASHGVSQLVKYNIGA